MERDEKIHFISILIENVLYRRLVATDEDDRLSYIEKQEAKKKYIKEFIANIPEAYKDVENIAEIVREVLIRMNQNIDFEDSKNLNDKNLKPKNDSSSVPEKER